MKSPFVFYSEISEVVVEVCADDMDFADVTAFSVLFTVTFEVPYTHTLLYCGHDIDTSCTKESLFEDSLRRFTFATRSLAVISFIISAGPITVTFMLFAIIS